MAISKTPLISRQSVHMLCFLKTQRLLDFGSVSVGGSVVMYSRIMARGADLNLTSSLTGQRGCSRIIAKGAKVARICVIKWIVGFLGRAPQKQAPLKPYPTNLKFCRPMHTDGPTNT